jgi:hypothetical protein
MIQSRRSGFPSPEEWKQDGKQERHDENGRQQWNLKHEILLIV